MSATANSRTLAAPTGCQPAAQTNSAQTWTIATDTSFSVSGYLPIWATENPSGPAPSSFPQFSGAGVMCR